MLTGRIESRGHKANCGNPDARFVSEAVPTDRPISYQSEQKELGPQQLPRFASLPTDTPLHRAQLPPRESKPTTPAHSPCKVLDCSETAF